MRCCDCGTPAEIYPLDVCGRCDLCAAVWAAAPGNEPVDAEAVRDMIAASLAAGLDIRLTTDDAANTITVAAVRDTIPESLPTGSTITFHEKEVRS